MISVHTRLCALLQTQFNCMLLTSSQRERELGRLTLLSLESGAIIPKDWSQSDKIEREKKKWTESSPVRGDKRKHVKMSFTYQYEYLLHKLPILSREGGWKEKDWKSSAKSSSTQYLHGACHLVFYFTVMYLWGKSVTADPIFPTKSTGSAKYVCFSTLNLSPGSPSGSRDTLLCEC